MRMLACLWFGLFFPTTLWAATTNVLETWESRNFQSPFTGSGDVGWTGDVNGFRITNATWAAGPDLGGSRSLRSLSSAVAVTNTILTPHILDPDLLTQWDVFVSGMSAGITSGQGFYLLLASSTNDAPLIEAGSMNGYRLYLTTRTGSIDSLLLQKAGGAGWSTLNYFDFGTNANLNLGWNLSAQRTAGGAWSYGFTTGSMGSAVALLNSTNDASIASGLYTGMGWVGTATEAADFGFDQFSVTTVIPEPSVGWLAGLTVFGFLWLNRGTQNGRRQ